MRREEGQGEVGTDGVTESKQPIQETKIGEEWSKTKKICYYLFAIAVARKSEMLLNPTRWEIVRVLEIRETSSIFRFRLLTENN